jgi:predicted phosphate transport protein (TIGR00153 family)
MFGKFLPRNFNFFDLFEKQAGYAQSAADYFKELAAKNEVDVVALDKMRRIEHQADEAAHDIIAQLNKTFITPFDREDIYDLTTELDDIVDMINTIASRMMIYKLKGQDKNLVRFAAVIQESVKGVVCAVKGMRNDKTRKSIAAACVEINRLENVGDAMRDEVLAELFETEKDPIKVIKLKEIYQDAETVLDVCEDVAHVIDSIIVKQA